jgi:hypothetical protein
LNRKKGPSAVNLRPVVLSTRVDIGYGRIPTDLVFNSEESASRRKSFCEFHEFCHQGGAHLGAIFIRSRSVWADGGAMFVDDSKR